MVSNLSVGEKVKTFRLKSKLSQFELENMIGASPGSLSRIENGQVNPTKETLVKISQILNLSSKEVGELFNITVEDTFIPVLNANYEVFKSLDLDIVLQASVDFIVKELKLFSCFIVLVEGNKIVAQSSTDNWPSRMARKILQRNIKGISTPLNRENPNLMVQCILSNKAISSPELHKFLYPAININLAKFLENITGANSCIAVPIELEGDVIGAIMFGKTENDDFSREKDALIEFCKHVGIAINNARQYEKLKQELNFLKQI